MKHKTQHNQPFGGTKTPRQRYNERKHQESLMRKARHDFLSNPRRWLADRDYQDALKLKKPSNLKVIHNLSTAPRQKRGRGDGTRSSVNSGDGNSSDSDPDPERRAQPSLQLQFQLYDQASLADLLAIDKHTVQNIYSATPWLLPPGDPDPRRPRTQMDARCCRSMAF